MKIKIPSKKAFPILVVLSVSVAILFSNIPTASAGVVDFLLEIAKEFYSEARYAEALHEFNKVLLIEPEHEEAKSYIRLIKQKLQLEERLAQKKREVVVEELVQAEVSPEMPREGAIEERLDKIELKLKKEVPVIKKPVKPAKAPEEALPEEKVIPLVWEAKEEVALDQKVKATQPGTKLALEIGKSFILRGKDIKRFLITPEGIISAKRIGIDRLEISAQKLGRAYLHVWDLAGRWTLNINTKPQQLFAAAALAERRRKEIERAGSFKLRYSNIRQSFYSGDDSNDLSRESLRFEQYLGFDGETPYGRVDTAATVSKLEDTTDLTYLTSSLTDGEIGNFRNFDLRLFDFAPSYSSLAFPGMGLRGANLNVKFPERDFDYTLFWGREGGGSFGRLSPGLAESKDSYISGARLRFSLADFGTYKLGYFHGYGSERETNVSNDVYDLQADYKLGRKLLFGYDVACDSENFAYSLNANLRIKKLSLSGTFRDVPDDFLSISGRPGGSGQLRGTMSLYYAPSEKLFYNMRLNLYKDRLHPHPEHEDWWNIDGSSRVRLRLTPRTSLTFDYDKTYAMGTLFPRRSYGMGLVLGHTFPILRGLNVHLSARRRASVSPLSPTSDYTNDSVSAGLRLGLTQGLYIYANQEYNWLIDEYADDLTNPQAFDIGLSCDSRIFESPFYTSMRLSYRNEKSGASVHSFLSGQEYINFSGTLSWRPKKDWEAFADCNWKKTWPETGLSRYDVDLSMGARLLFDTGWQWNPLGNITGKVYKDLNSDGERQDNEPGFKGIKLYMAKKEAISSATGDFDFLKIRGKKAYVELDASSLPLGFVATTPSTQEIELVHGKISEVNFGIIGRSQIRGMIFKDLNNNDIFDTGDEGAANVVVYLEDGSRSQTDQRGRYYFREVSAGKHTVTMFLESLPIELLPKVPISQEVEITEGMTYIYDIPLRPLR